MLHIAYCVLRAAGNFEQVTRLVRSGSLRLAEISRRAKPRGADFEYDWVIPMLFAIRLIAVWPGAPAPGHRVRAYGAPSIPGCYGLTV